MEGPTADGVAWCGQSDPTILEPPRPCSDVLGYWPLRRMLTNGVFTMPWRSSLLLALGWLGIALAEPPVELSQPQSPPLPPPGGLRWIDQGKYDPRLEGYQTPEGFKLEIVAEEPTVINPVGMTFGPDGTLYVLEWKLDQGNNFPEHLETITYQDGTTRQISTMKKKVLDQVKVLHRDDEGLYTRAEVILEDQLPSSILVHDGWVYLSGRGTVRRYRPSKPDGPYDIKEVIAKGFCGFHHHQVSGMTIGNDGKLYITSGDDDNLVEGSDGSRATVLRTGAVFRCNPDGSDMEVFSIGYRNPYRDLAFDKHFHWFHVDNDNEDGSKFTGCRLMHVAEGSDYGWRLALGARCCKPDHMRGAVFGEQPGKLPAMLKTGRGSPAGLLIYHDQFFPERYQGLLYYPDVFRRLIRAYRVEPRGASFAVTEEFPLLRSPDPLFRPCQMVTGPDGAIYICDWRTDSGGAGKLWGDGEHGRIYRLRWLGTSEEPNIPLRSMNAWSRITAQSTEQLLASLGAANLSDRRIAQFALVGKGKSLLPKLISIISDVDQSLEARIMALGAAQQAWDSRVRTTCLNLLNDSEAELRRLAVDALAIHVQPGDRQVAEALVQSLADVSPMVRRSVVLAIGRVGGELAPSTLVNVWRFDDESDPFLADAILRGLERTGASGVQELLHLVNSGDQKARAKAVAAMQAFRIRPGGEALTRFLNHPHLTRRQRVTLIQSFLNYQLEPPLSVIALVDYLRDGTHPAEIHEAGLRVLQNLDFVDPRPVTAYLQRLLDHPSISVRLAAIDTVARSQLTALAEPLRERLTSHQPSEPETLALIRALRSIGDQRVARTLESMVRSDLILAIRVEALRSLATLVPKDGFALATQLLPTTPRPELRDEAMSILGTRPEGAKLVAETFLAGQLPRSTLPRVSELLQTHFVRRPELRELLTKVMTTGLNVRFTPNEVEKIRQEMVLQGDPKRGRTLYFDAAKLACVRCHKLEGVGGQIGPDLTRIWETHTLDKLLEAMLEPSKEIKEGYQTYQAATLSGQLYTGLKIKDNDREVILRESNGKEVRIPRDELEELVVAKQSLMPDNVTALLSYAELIDLMAFLKDRVSQERLRGLPFTFEVIGPFPSHWKGHYAPEKDPTQPHYTIGQSQSKLAWQTVTVKPNGYLDLSGVFSGEQQSAYVRFNVDSLHPQKATLLLGIGGQARIWVNQQLAHEQFTPTMPKPEQKQVHVQLRGGRNTIVVRLIEQPQGFGMYLSLVGDQSLRIDRPSP